MEKEQLKDDLLKSLLKSGQTEKPGHDFTSRVMGDVQQYEAEKSRNPWWSWGSAMLVVGGLTALLLVYFVVSPFLGDYRLFGQGIDPERFGEYFNAILSSFQSLLSVIEFLRESTITLIVLLVIPSLFLLDLILKRASSRTYLFLF